MKTSVALSPIRVVPVDDSAFAREGIRAILKLDRGIQVVGEAGSRACALEEVHRTQPDVVILDMRLPDGTGSDACRDILSAFPRMRILFFSAYNDDQDLYDAVMAGGHGYLTKDAGAKDLLRAIKTIAAGQSLLEPQKPVHNSSRMTRAIANSPTILMPPLSRTDLKLLAMLAEGATIKAIAAAFKTKQAAITKLLATLYRTLGVTRRNQAIHYFITQISRHRRPSDVSPLSTHRKG
ncbi:response regulator transcription factor [Nitrospira lenta]|uniref:Putative Transcriptional regulatory protein DevR (DosR) n=1 Tax=Nitrospira lenta TaxID=1436998 RepID=A0A330L5Z1_9BACT|nr:response regulator transcription factor [Nitrospira lenta]SPP64405.1 putative Transcriptional regulatory protein DevR (DosR) [Nitrospira lenta]